MKPDILSRDDIKLLVDTFYDKVKSNPVIGFIFDEVAKVDWQKHLPKMYDFWSTIVLGDQSYEGNPMITHIRLSKITPLTEKEFSEWILLFNATVDELFEGANAAEAKTRAGNIARLMLFKIQTR
jgi:hemoglobin